MSSENRQLPASNVSRLIALHHAKDKNDALGLSTFLTSATQTRLGNILALYDTATDDIPLKKQAMITLTTQKENAKLVCSMYVSHFIQVFNFGVARGVYPADDRSFYSLDVANGFVPELRSEDDILLWSNRIVNGDAARVAAGGAAMSNPTAAEVHTKLTAFGSLRMPHSTASDAYDAALETLDALNPEADKVIKKVWDEVETFYNEEDPSSMRENARKWGVVYIRTGGSKTISGKVTRQGTDVVIEGAEVHFENGNNSVLTDAQGNYELSTTLMGDQVLKAEADLYDNFEITVTLAEGETQTVNIEMVLKV